MGADELSAEPISIPTCEKPFVLLPLPPYDYKAGISENKTRGLMYVDWKIYRV